MAVLWAEEPPKEEKKEEVKLDPAEQVKLGRGMAFQAYSAEQQEAWSAAKDLYTALWPRLRRFPGFGSGGVFAR